MTLVRDHEGSGNPLPQVPVGYLHRRCSNAHGRYRKSTRAAGAVAPIVSASVGLEVGTAIPADCVNHPNALSLSSGVSPARPFGSSSAKSCQRFERRVSDDAIQRYSSLRFCQKRSLS